MSDQMEGTAPAGDETTEAPPEVTPDDMISRGKGMTTAAIDALAEDHPAKVALASFTELVARQKAAEEEAKALTLERNQAIHDLKDEQNVGFSAIAEIIGNTSSLVLYLYQRAEGKSAKEIREESERSRLAKEQFRESDPNKPAARKQSPAEKELRAKQRAELKAFLESQKEAGEDVGDGDPDAPTDDD